MNPELTHLSQVSARGVIPGIKKKCKETETKSFRPCGNDTNLSTPNDGRR